MQRLTGYIAWILLLGAFGALAGVGYFAHAIGEESATRADQLRRQDAQAAKDAADIRVRALAKDSEADRGRLSDMLDIGILEIVDILEVAGKAAGVKLHLSDALPENSARGGNSGDLRAVGFQLQADGTFPSIMRAVQLFESLPVLASIQRLDISHTESSEAGGQWHLSAYIRVLTSAAISS